jgi:hypothetical protein
MINVGLFVLTGSLRMALLVAAGTIACWWVLSDYFMAGFPFWNAVLDAIAFIPASALLVAAIARLGCRRVARDAKFAASLPPPLPAGFAMEAASYGDALLDLRARAETSEAARVSRMFGPFALVAPTHYFGWFAERLRPLPPRMLVSADRLARCWWLAWPNIWRVWIRSLWLPLLWAVLHVLPLYTNVTDMLADRFHPDPAEIFDVIVRGRMPAQPGTSVPPMQAESLTRERDSFRRTTWQQVTTKPFINGWVDVHATLHPRVYRRIRVVCGGTRPACVIGRDANVLGLEVVATVRNGPVRLNFIHQVPEPGLDVYVQLLRWDGAVIDEGRIRPHTGSTP